MKNFALFIVFLLLVSCKTITQNDKESSADAIADTANQHIAVGVLLAQHHCELGSWPVTFTKLQEFQLKGTSKMPVEINWKWLNSPNVQIKISEVITVRTSDGIEENHGVVITSLHEAPECDGNNIKVNTSLNVGG